MLRGFILDDEQDCISLMLQDIERYCPEVEVVGTATNVAEAIEKYEELGPDVLFVDVLIGEETGFDFLDRIDYLGTKVIFVTGHDEFAIKAFKYSAIDYLIKPIDGLELEAAVNRISNIQQQDSQLKIDTLLSSLSEDRYSKLLLPSKDGIRIISPKEVAYVRADGSYTFFHLSDGKKVMVSKSLSYYSDVLPINFLRIHNSHQVNSDFIEKYVYGDGGHVVMKDGSSLAVSKRRKGAFLKAMGMN